MSFKNLLVTFVSSEEASITQRSALRLGSVLTVVMLVVMVTVAMTPMSVAAGGSCCPFGCSGAPCGSPNSVSACPPGPCSYDWRDCYEGWTEWQYQCSGGWTGCECP